jgi:ATP adenylyltransferase
MQYITDTEKPPGCVFCTKAREHRDEENGILFRGQNLYVILNAFPYNPGHLMIVPYEHVSSLTQLPEPVAGELMFLTQRSIDVLAEAMAPEGLNVGVNQGHAAGAGIADHIHLHIVPRWLGDTNYMTSVGETRVLPELVRDTYVKLAPIFARVSD